MLKNSKGWNKRAMAKDLRNPVGFRAVVVFNLLSGFWIPVPPVKLAGRTLIRYIIDIYSFMLVLLFAVETIYIVNVTLNVPITKKWTLPLILSISQITYNTCLIFRSIIIIIHRKKLLKVIKRLRNILHSPYFNTYKNSLMNRLSRRCIIYLAVPFFTLLTYEIYISINNNLLDELTLNTNQTNFGNETMAETEIQLTSVVNRIASNSVLRVLFIGFSIFSQLLILCKGTAMDALFLGIVHFVTEELNILACTLEEAILLSKSSIKLSDCVNLSVWLEHQRKLAG
jgi:hypothetical protein